MTNVKELLFLKSMLEAEALQPVLRAKRRVQEYAYVIRYTFPNLLRPQVPLSPRGKEWLATMQRDGILRAEDEAFREAVDHLERSYFARLENGRTTPRIDLGKDMFILDIGSDRLRKTGTSVHASISFTDPQLASVFFHADLNAVLYNYYRRQPFFRNQPLVQTDAYDGRVPAGSNGQFHVDYLHQVSLMLLVTDVTTADTHMQYALGSHKRIWPVGISPEGTVERFGYRVADVIGSKGTLYLFDAGGIHRANYVAGTRRKILHMNFTTGHHISGGRYDRLEACPGASSFPAYSRRLMDRVRQR